MSELTAVKVVPEVLFNNEAECCVLAAAIIDISMIDRVGGFLDPKHFADSALGQFWLILCCMRETQKSQPDMPAIVREIREAGIYDQIGGMQGLVRISQSQANAGHIVYHANKVREALHRRQLAAMAKQLYYRATDPQHDTIKTAEWASASMDMYSTDPTESMMDLREACESAITRIETARKTKNSIGMGCGIGKVDSATKGLFRGELIVLAARTGIGKTALATQIGYGVASKGEPVLMVSLEMEQWEIAIRILAAETGVTVENLKSATIEDTDLEVLKATSESVHDVPLYLWRPYTASVKQIRAKARMMKATKGLSLLIIDYISLVKPENPRIPRHEQISEMMKALKPLASELGVPIIVLSQLRRDTEGKEPKISDLRESGSMEEDANSVWLLHRPDRDSSDADLMVVKSRNGKSGYVKLHYDGSRTTFSDPDLGAENF